MIKRRYLVLLLCWLPFAGLSQESYYSTDTLFQSGVKIVYRGYKSNARICYIVEGKDTLVFTPNDINEYGINGTVYVSAEVPIVNRVEKVFLRRVYKGEVSLYAYHGKGLKTFFLEREGGGFLPLPKVDKENPKITYKDLLERETLDCEYALNNLRHTRYSESSLAVFLHKYQHCSNRPMPATRLGFYGGLSQLNISPVSLDDDSYSSLFNKTSQPSWLFGAFVDIPLFYSDFSATLGARLLTTSQSYFFIAGNLGQDLVINATKLEIPILIKYAPFQNRIRPYLTAGPVFSFNLKDESLFFLTNFSQEIITIERHDHVTSSSTLAVGATAGLGAEYKFNRRNAVFLELHFSFQNAIENRIEDRSSRSFLLNQTGIQLFTGISF